MTMTKAGNSMALTWTIIFLLITGCTTNQHHIAATATTSTPELTSKRNLSHIKVGYCSPSLNASFYVALAKAVESNARSYGMDFISVDGQGDITRQITGIEDMVAKGVKILIVNPLDTKALVSTINAAQKSGVAVFIVDSYIDPHARYVSSVFADNSLNGELLGEWLANKFANQKVNAALISGNQGNQVGKEKRLGFISGLAEGQLRAQGKTNFTITTQGWGGWANNEGLKAMEDILSAHPEINVLMAENDAMALGALRAVKEFNKQTNITVVAFDGQKEALKLIEQGKYGATALNSPALLGKLVVQAVVRYLNKDTALDKVMYTPALLIDKENANQLYDPNAAF